LFGLKKKKSKGKFPIAALHIPIQPVKEEMNKSHNMKSLLKCEEILKNLLNNQCLKLSSQNPFPLSHIIAG